MAIHKCPPKDEDRSAKLDNAVTNKIAFCMMIHAISTNAHFTVFLSTAKRRASARVLQ
jgi:hypothetical protein